tara:strand:- start:165 stop:689 length:525 start_codon:yes stop_codon:yes gene_type:complete
MAEKKRRKRTREVKISSLSQEKVDKDRVYHQTIVDDMKKFGNATVNLTFRSTQRNQVKNMKEFERKKLLRKKAREKKKEENKKATPKTSATKEENKKATPKTSATKEVKKTRKRPKIMVEASRFVKRVLDEKIKKEKDERNKKVVTGVGRDPKESDKDTEFVKPKRKRPKQGAK